MLLTAVTYEIYSTSRYEKKRHSEQQLNLSRLMLDKNPGKALLLSMEGTKDYPSLSALQALSDALLACREVKTSFVEQPVWGVAFLSGGNSAIACRS